MLVRQTVMDGLKTVTKRQQVRAGDPEVLVGLGVITEYISGTAQITWLKLEARLVWMCSGTVGVSDKGC